LVRAAFVAGFLWSWVAHATETELLTVTVLDENLIPTPCLIHIKNDVSGEIKAPRNAVDFGEAVWSIPAPFMKTVEINSASEQFWAVEAGPIEFDLLPGDWTLTVRRGFETKPSHHQVNIVAGSTPEDVEVILVRWSDVLPVFSASGWYSGDGHVHAILDDVSTGKLLTLAQAEDVHVLNILQMGNLEDLFFVPAPGFGPGTTHQSGDYFLVPGQEDPRTPGFWLSLDDRIPIGHALALNLSESLVRDTSQYFRYDSMFDGARAQGALTGYAHVNYPPSDVHRDMSINVPFQKADFAEILQFPRIDGALGTDLYYEFLDLGMRLTAGSGSDCPWGLSVGDSRVYVHLDEPLTVESWFEAFDEGHTFVSSGFFIDLKIHAVNNDFIPGDEVIVETGSELIEIYARVVGNSSFDTPQQLELVTSLGADHGIGGLSPIVTEALNSDGTTTKSIVIEHQVMSGDGFWIAARAYGSETEGGDVPYAAHTSPIWIVREGTRPWKQAVARDAIAKRKSEETLYGSLTVLELAGEAQTGGSEFNEDWEFGGLRERVASAREYYECLEQGLSDANIPDFDGDAMPDCADNCIDAYNPVQDDTDGDGIGDACDPACGDGLDNDGDGFIDFPGDPGCVNSASPIEDPECQDGVNNDPGQEPDPGLIDWDGGASAGVPLHEQTDPDPECMGTPWRNKERQGTLSHSCGLGIELALLLPPLMWLCWRRRCSLH